MMDSFTGTPGCFFLQIQRLFRRNKYPLLPAVTFFLLIFQMGAVLYAGEKIHTGVIELSEKTDRFYIGLKGEYLEDRSGGLSFEQVISSEYARRFMPINQKIMNIGYTGSVYWVRFQVKNRDSQKNRWWLNIQQVWARKIDIYIRYHDHTVHREAGVNFPFPQREVKINDFVFPLVLSENKPVRVYIRISSSSLQMNISLWSPARYMEEYSLRELFNGFYYGLIFVMAIYTFMIFLSVLDRSYLYYALYLTFMGLFLLSNSGYAFSYIWPHMAETGISVYFIFVSLLLIVGIFLSVHFLDMRKNFPKVYRFMMILTAAPVSIAVLFFFPRVRESVYLRPFTVLTGSVIILMSFIISFISFRRGFRPARYYMLAWIFLLGGVTVFMLKQFGVIPESVFFEYGIHIGNTLEVAFISLALTHRIRLIRREKENAQLNALEAQRVLAEELEEKVRERTNSLQQSEARFRALADATFEGIIICRQRRIIDCNYIIMDMSGYTALEMDGKTVTGLFLSRDNDLFRKIFRSGLNHPVEILMKTKKGTFIPVEILGKNISQGGKKILIIAVRDIRERKKTRRMKENIERMIRHDLKTPLSAIIEFSNLMASGTGPPRYRKFAGIIRENSLQMNEMLGQSLDLFKIEEGIYHIFPAEFDMLSLLKRIDRNFSGLKRSFGVQVLMRLDNREISETAEYPIVGDENQLYNLFANLIKNAIEASQPEGCVSISLSRGKSYHQVRIHNEGEIPEEIKSRIFEAYVTGGKTGGMGLGIYSARIIAASHRGDISFKTSKNGGTTFSVKLPFKLPERK